MLSAITFFILLSILVLIHEFGHYYVAKKSGMLVEEFGFGLPPRIYGIKVGETLYSLNLLPFGGFVKIFGESPDDLKSKKISPDLKKRAFNNKPWKQRAAVLLAGPAMNFVLAVIVISYMFTQGVYLPSDTVRIVGVDKNSPAAIAGLQKKDIIVSIDSKPVTSSNDVIKTAQQKAGKEAVIEYERNGQTYHTVIIPRKNPPQGQGAVGVVITDLEYKSYPFYLAPFIGVWESIKISLQFYQELGKLIFQLVTFQKPQVQVAGPVGIAKLTSDAVKTGFTAVLQLLGLLSLNLALINLIPFPALDGGQLVFVLYEGTTRRKINENFKAKVNAIGFAVLIFLLLFITFKDIRGLIK